MPPEKSTILTVVTQWAHQTFSRILRRSSGVKDDQRRRAEALNDGGGAAGMAAL